MPTLQDLKAMIYINLIKDNKIKSSDIDLAKRTFGLDIGCIKAKSTRNKPILVQSNIIDILEELLEVHQDLTLSINGMKVNSLPFLTTISHNIYF